MASLRVRVWVAPVLAVVAAACLAAAFVAAGAPAQPHGSAALADERPNIILITTDDQATYDLGWMAHTQDLLVSHGITFSHALSPHPLCCPARAEILTGQYAQNNGVQHNGGPRGGYSALRRPGNTVARWLHDAGYQTAMVGKYLNGYHGETRPAGWDHWNAFVERSQMMSTRYYDDGNPVTRTGYVDDVTNQYALDYLDEFSRAPAPFFLWVSNYAPHRAVRVPGWDETAYPAPRFQGTLAHVESPVLAKPSFNERDVGDQPGYVRAHKRRDPDDMQRRFTHRIEALQAADEGVRDLVAALVETGELDNTYVFLTSDQGFLLGEHRLLEKNVIFQEALLVPFVVRGPGITGPLTSDVPVTLVDLAPTIAELAGVEPGRVQDGTSFAGVLTGTGPAWRDTQLIQTAQNRTTAGGWWVRGVRTARYTYGRDLTNGFEQLYDRSRDPYETRNVASWGAYLPVLRELRRRFSALRDCAGPRCVRTFGPEPLPR